MGKFVNANMFQGERHASNIISILLKCFYKICNLVSSHDKTLNFVTMVIVTTWCVKLYETKVI